MCNQYLPPVYLSAHAIDRLSLRCLDIWQKDGGELGLMAFFKQKSREAYSVVLRNGGNKQLDKCRVSYQGITYIFDNDDEYMTKLVTVWRC